MASENRAGRVGRLAVALGIGAAVATGWSTPAWADESASSSPASASQGSSPNASSGGSDSATAGRVASRTKISTKESAAAGKPGKSKPGVRKGKSTVGPSRADHKTTETSAPTPAAVQSDDDAAIAPVVAQPLRDNATPKTNGPEHRPAARPAKLGFTNIRSASVGGPERSESTDTAMPPTDVGTRTTEQSVTVVPATPSNAISAAVAVATSTTETTGTPILIAAVAGVNTDRSASTPAPISPMQATTVLAVLAAARDELERDNSIQSATAASAQPTALAADNTPNVLVIGVDGTNLARILADPANVNFLTVIQGGTTAVASIAGHTTLSNPSWTAVLTGLWGERTGVINNIYNPAVYDRWPTVFNQLEALDPAIQTTAIADWDVVAAIAASGSIPADSVLYVPQISGDTNWLRTDDAVGDATEAAIAAADPTIANFVFSYFAGVDENGHLYGGASSEYADAVQNIDRNLGEILTVVNAWEAATGEQWTIIMVTDHGHQPQLGFGHGFQSPDETTTFVIANNPDLFTAGGVNTAYQIVDVTPTVVTIFGGTPARSDGVSLTTLGDATETYGDTAALLAALHARIGAVDYPDLGTNLRLGVRTVFASIPYFLVDIVDGIVGELHGISAEGTPFSPLAYLAIGPVQFAGDALYVATNILAQIVARLTGVTGNSIFPLLPPDLPDLQTPGPATTAAVLCGVYVAGAAAACGEGAVAV